MFAYSSFFNSGLNATSDGRVVSTSPGSRHHRRSSFPESTTYTSSSHKTTSAYYVSLQRRGQSEQRSFLSLDLAESRLSLRHGPTTSTSSWLIPPVPALPPLVISPLTSHFSSTTSLRSPTADSLRSVPLPDPKPAPSIMLPDPPPPPYSQHQQRTPPRLPELPVLPALQFPLPPTHIKIPQRPLPSPPSPPPSPCKSSSQTPFSTTEDDIAAPSPILPRSSVLTKPKHLRSKKRGVIPDRLSKSSFSTVSTRVRRRNRWDALDTLEGRRKQPSSAPGPVPPVPQRKDLKMDDVFVKPTTFAPPTKPLSKPTPKHTHKRVVPNFMNMSDDSDPEPDSSSVSEYDSDVHPRLTLHPNNTNRPLYPNTNATLPNPLLEPEDIVLPAAPPRPPRPPSSILDALSYLDVEEEAVVLEATRYPAPSSPPPPVVAPIPPTLPWTSRVKGPVERHVKPSLAPSGTGHAATKKAKEKEKDRTKSKSKHHHHQQSSSRRHKPSTSTSLTNGRTNHTHYKSFIELDMDDLLEPDSASAQAASSAGTVGVIVEDPEAEVELFEWRGRMGRGLAEGGGEWVWI